MLQKINIFLIFGDVLNCNDIEKLVDVTMFNIKKLS